MTGTGTRWTGYRLPSDPAGYEELREGFAWELPERYNVAAAALDGDPTAVAVRHVTAAGRRRTLTYGDLDRASAAVAARLADGRDAGGAGADGVGRGDRVAVCLPQCPELVVAHLAVLRLGAVCVPASMLLGEPALDHVLDHSGARAFLVDAERHGELSSGTTSGVARTVPVEVDPAPTDGSGAPDDGEGAALGADRLGGLRPFVGSDPSAAGGGDATGDPVAAPGEQGPDRGTGGPDGVVAATTPDDPAYLLYTSGTTSEPKGVHQAHRYLLGSLPGYHCYFHLFDRASARAARVWTPSEWAWAGALFDVVFPTLAVGGTVVSRVRRAGFDPAVALELLASERVTHAFVPPTALGRVREGAVPADYDLAALSVVMCGGEHLPPSLASWAEAALDVAVNEAYGLTEANALVGSSEAVYATEPGALGRPYPGHEVAVVDEEGTPLPAGEPGQLVVDASDPAVMLGYWDDPEGTAAVLDDDWLWTGDLAVRGESGAVTHRGRADDLIVTSGYRVSPLEVESVLEAADGVAAAVVGGVPDEERGAVVGAYVVPVGGVASVDEPAFRDRLQRLVADELGAYKKPRRVTFVDELPTTRTDKADRSALFGRE